MLLLVSLDTRWRELSAERAALGLADQFKECCCIALGHCGEAVFSWTHKQAFNGR
jgi:hypothetical protein